MNSIYDEGRHESAEDGCPEHLRHARLVVFLDGVVQLISEAEDDAEQGTHDDTGVKDQRGNERCQSYQYGIDDGEYDRPFGKFFHDIKSLMIAIMIAPTAVPAMSATMSHQENRP